jgi:hypothetical protein
MDWLSRAVDAVVGDEIGVVVQEEAVDPPMRALEHVVYGSAGHPGARVSGAIRGEVETW